MKHNPSADTDMVRVYGVPVIFSTLASVVQASMRMFGVSPEKQMEWYRLEKQLLHGARMLYSGLSEPEIVARWGRPDEPDRVLD